MRTAPLVSTGMRRILEPAIAILVSLALGSYLASRGPDLPIGILGGMLLTAVVWVSLRKLPEGDASLAQWAFAINAALRMLLALLLHKVIRNPGALAGDDSAYEQFGRLIAQLWRGEVLSLGWWLEGRLEASTLGGSYYYWNAFWFYTLGEVPLLVKMINAVLGGLVPVFLYRIACRLYGNETGRYTLLLASVIPSLVLWSSLNLRDGPATLAITASVYYAVRLKEEFSTALLVKLLAAMFFVVALRSYMFIILGGALGLSFVGLRKGRELRDLAVGLLVVLGLAYLFQSFDNGQNSAFSNASFQQLHSMRKGLAEGNSAYAVGADISSPGKALLFLPVGIAYLLFAPFPWQISGFRQVLAAPEVLLFYALVPSMIRGTRRIIQEGIGRSLPVLLPTVLVTTAYALVEGNVGTAYRHKSQIVGLFLILAARDLAARRSPGGPPI